MIKGLKRYHYDTDRLNIVGMVGLDRMDHIGLVPDPNFKTIPKVPVPFIGGRVPRHLPRTLPIRRYHFHKQRARVKFDH